MRSEALLKSLAEKLCGEGLRAEPSRSQAVGGPDDEVSTLHDRLRTASLDAKMMPWVAHRSMSSTDFRKGEGHSLRTTEGPRPSAQSGASKVTLQLPLRMFESGVWVDDSANDIGKKIHASPLSRADLGCARSCCLAGGEQ